MVTPPLVAEEMLTLIGPEVSVLPASRVSDPKAAFCASVRSRVSVEAVVSTVMVPVNGSLVLKAKAGLPPGQLEPAAQKALGEPEAAPTRSELRYSRLRARVRAKGLIGRAAGWGGGGYSPATVMPSISTEPVRRPPRASMSVPRATMLRNISRRLPAIVISWTG